jgi:hypothetical protein
VRNFFERLDDPLILRRMARSCADVGEADLLQKRPDIALVEVDAEPPLSPETEIPGFGQGSSGRGDPCGPTRPSSLFGQNPISRADFDRGCVKISARFHTSLFRSLFRGLRAFRVEKIAKNLALLDRSQNFAEFLHGLDPLQSSGDSTRKDACAQGADILCDATGRIYLPGVHAFDLS